MKKLILLLCLMGTLFSAGFAFAEQSEGIAWIDAGTSDRVHLRAAPSQEAKSLGLYFSGVAIYYHSDLTQEWVEVTIGKESGYMMSRYLYNGPHPENVPYAKHIGVVKAKDWVNLREAPTTNSQQLNKLYGGEELTIYGETAGHWYLVFADGYKGYVHSDYVTMTGEVREPIRYFQGRVDTTSPLPANLQAVLHENERFYHAQAEMYVSLSEIGEKLFEGASVTFPRYAYVDVDNYGEKELVLEQCVNGDHYYGYLVLQRADSIVWGYEFVYRSMFELKEDGTFSFSSSAADSGFGYARFGGSASIVPLAHSQSAGKTIQYFKGDESISEPTFHALLVEQNAKKNAEWFPIGGMPE